MIKILARRLIKNYEDTDDRDVREKYGILSGVLGLICNLVLFIIKILIGTFVNSIAIISDAFNNLTDIGSSAITIISAKMSNTPPDQEHPMGHGRFEYIASLVVSLVILLVGFELLKSSVGKIINPEEMEFNSTMMIILSLSVLIKVWMYSYNKYIAKKINSSVMKATAMDSISDVFATLGVVLALLVGKFFDLNLDGYIGTVVSVLILYTGFTIAKETTNLLLGMSPDEELLKEIDNIVKSGEFIMGTHDLKVHDYGPGRRVASIHAEVPDYVDIAEAHASIDEIEDEVKDKLNIEIVVHMDPILTDPEVVLETKKKFVDILKEIDEDYKIRNFRMTSVKRRCNIIFDLEIDYPLDKKRCNYLANDVKKEIQEINPKFNIVINSVITKSESKVIM